MLDAPGCLTSIKLSSCNGSSHHATGVRGRLRFDPFPAEKGLSLSGARLSGEAVNGNPTTTVIPGVDESKPSHRATDDSTEPEESPERSPESLASDNSPCPADVLERLPF